MLACIGNKTDKVPTLPETSHNTERGHEKKTQVGIVIAVTKALPHPGTVLGALLEPCDNALR